MDETRFAAMTRSLLAPPSRRGVLRLALSGVASALLGLTDAGAKKKRKKKKKKSSPPPPPPAPPSPPPLPPPPRPICAGKNWCVDQTECGAGGEDCFCWVRADNGPALCGTLGNGASNCGNCPGTEVCVVGTGGFCDVSPFRCVSPCPNPL